MVYRYINSVYLKSGTIDENYENIFFTKLIEKWLCAKTEPLIENNTFGNGIISTCVASI